MIARCGDPEHPKYRLYGARGISVCDEWQNFRKYVEAVRKLGLPPTPDHKTIDRIDNDRNYEPGNIRWATNSEQMSNRRPYRQTKIRDDTKTKITYEGKPITITHAAELLGCRYDTLKQRLRSWRKSRPGLVSVSIEELRR